VKLSSLTIDEASALSVHALGLDAEVIDLLSQEGLAASLRRAASFMCPTNPRRLLDAVLSAVRPLSPDGGVSRDHLAELLDLLVAAGDLLELRHEVGRSVRLLYLGPPSFIEREAGSYLLLGVRPFGAPLVDTELGERIESEGHTRTIRLDAETARDRLVGAGLQLIDRQRWVASPRTEDPRSLVDRVGEQLDTAGPSGDIEDLVVLDPDRPVRYYRGRWRPPQAHDSGDFIARRPQAYGADLWCCVRLEDGMPKKMVEFPIDNPVVPGRDEAWRMQMAIDALRSVRQRYRTTPATGADATVVSFFSPIPGFAERYLQLVGLALAESHGSLFAFRVPNGAMPALEALLTDMLWMEPVAKDGSL
jgi:hypothetical protein